MKYTCSKSETPIGSYYEIFDLANKTIVAVVYDKNIAILITNTLNKKTQYEKV